MISWKDGDGPEGVCVDGMMVTMVLLVSLILVVLLGL